PQQELENNSIPIKNITTPHSQNIQLHHLINYFKNYKPTITFTNTTTYSPLLTQHLLDQNVTLKPSVHNPPHLRRLIFLHLAHPQRIL
ncbi:hypothetical protein, partial [Staphylococcus capitis]|uniref:hypothetical protein n=1 Tax=Staphylococcus capitis TaxID=29388 RepID=UPI001C93029B